VADVSSVLTGMDKQKRVLILPNSDSLLRDQIGKNFFVYLQALPHFASNPDT